MNSVHWTPYDSSKFDDQTKSSLEQMKSPNWPVINGLMINLKQLIKQLPQIDFRPLR